MMDIKDFKKRRNIAILGSTGSIGTQALDVVRGMGLHVTALCANRSIELLEKQAREFKPEVVAVMDESTAAELKIKLADTSVKVLQGMDGFIQAATLDSNDDREYPTKVRRSTLPMRTESRRGSKWVLWSSTES